MVIMTRARFVSLVLLSATIAGASGSAVRAQGSGRQAEAPQTTARAIDLQPEWTRYQRSPRPVVRIWQDFLLKSTDSVGDVVVVSGDATIDGLVDGDLVVVFGSARLSRTAIVDGSLIVVAGSATVADGAVIHRDFVVVGGAVDASTSFTPGGEHIVVGATRFGDQIRAVVPWVTYGLLWGRLIVPSLAWIWGIVAIALIVTLAINLVLHRPVGACADTIAARPFTTFLVGLLVLLLVAPVSALLAVTVIGLAIVPFLWSALLVGWIVGKVGVARWIGRAIVPPSAEETRGEALRSCTIGFAAMCLLYMVPVLGLVAWAMIGVFGLGSAWLACMVALRRERPSPPPVTVPPPVPTDAPPPPPSPPVGSAVPDLPAPAASYLVDPPRSDPPRSEAWVAAPPIAAAPAALGAPPGADVDLTLMPRAGFLDRLFAFVLDVALVLIIVAMADLRVWAGFTWLVLFGYFIAFWTWKGTTLGGIVCSLRVIRTDGTPLQVGDSLVRVLASLFSFAALGLGCLWILRDPERQSWHDKIAGTYVVKVPRHWPLP